MRRARRGPLRRCRHCRPRCRVRRRPSCPPPSCPLPCSRRRRARPDACRAAPGPRCRRRSRGWRSPRRRARAPGATSRLPRHRCSAGRGRGRAGRRGGATGWRGFVGGLSTVSAGGLGEVRTGMVRGGRGGGDGRGGRDGRRGAPAGSGSRTGLRTALRTAPRSGLRSGLRGGTGDGSCARRRVQPRRRVRRLRRLRPLRRNPIRGRERPHRPRPEPRTRPRTRPRTVRRQRHLPVARLRRRADQFVRGAEPADDAPYGRRGVGALRGALPVDLVPERRDEPHPGARRQLVLLGQVADAAQVVVDELVALDPHAVASPLAALPRR